MRQRKNIQNLGDSEFQEFQRAVKALRDSIDAKANYEHFAQIHVDSCQHGCELFLPWHRAYIQDYEDALRKISPNVTLPYWDWIGTPSIPDRFKNPPLDHERDPGGGNTQLPVESDVKDAVDTPDFYVFGGVRCSAPPFKGKVELQHGLVHTWVGGDMADMDTFRAAFDPIFWSHHANVDRLWAQWQGKFGNDGPSDTSASLSGLDTARTVANVLNIGPDGLGYEYVEDSVQLRKSGLLGAKEDYAISISRTRFGRAEIRLEGSHAVNGSPVPTDIEIGVPGSVPYRRISLYGMHSMAGNGGHAGDGMGETMMKTSARLDFSDEVRRATQLGNLGLQLRMVAPRRVAPDICRLGIERVEIVLFPEGS